MIGLTAPVALVEREQHVGALHAALEQVLAGHGHTVLVEGPPGIGKSRLLGALCALAAERGVTVLRARGSDMEADFPFGLVRQLFERALAISPEAVREQLLGGGAEPARAIVHEATVTPFTPDVAGHAILHGLYWLTANLATCGPILLAVDDAHWADPASVRFLHHLTARLDGLEALLVVARRPREPGTDDSVLDSLATLTGVTRLAVPPLSEAGTSSLVRSLIPEAHSAYVEACHRATGGNPFLVVELLRTADDEGLRPCAVEADKLSQLGSAAISRGVLVRLGRLGGAAVLLARAAAVLGPESRLDHVAAVAGLDLEQAGIAADAMAASGVLRSVQPVDLSHPAVQAAIYADIPSAERAGLHRRAAVVLGTAGMPAEAHLLRTPPSGDAATAGALAGAAERALLEGAPDMAAVLARRAIAEPPAATERASVLRVLGAAETASGRPADAAIHLREALLRTRDPVARAELAGALSLAHILSCAPEAAVAVLEDALAEVAPHSAEGAIAVEAAIAGVARLDRRLRDRGRRHAVTLRHRISDANGVVSPSARLALVQLAVEATCSGEPAASAAALARRALDGGALLSAETSDSHAIVLAGLVLIFCDEFEDARGALDAMLADAAARGSVSGFVQASCLFALLSHRVGLPVDAEGHARRSLEALPEPQPQLAPLQLAALADALVAKNDLEGAEAAFASFPLGGPSAEGYHVNHLLCSRGWLHLAARRPADALADFEEAGRRQMEWLMPNPAILDWRSGAARALLALGRRREADERAAEEVELARQFGAPRALGRALVSHGLTNEGKVDLLEEAVSVLEPTPAVLDYAEALFELGSALRRARRPALAREPLRRALALSRERQGHALAVRAEQELLAAGARPRRHAVTGLESLTPSELRVAKLAAEGHTNRQIARMLFVTQKTVEDHLGHVYSKLHITGRPTLGAALNRVVGK